MFKGIEGARGWLAWTVVASHIVQITGLSNVISKVGLIEKSGHYAVGLFIVISGFVITNLVMGKPEPYGLYIARRALRIYPAYLVCLAIGIFASGMTFDALLSLPTNIDRQEIHVAARQVEFQQHFWQHLVAHLTLLHGVIPNNILNESQYMFLGPAWSLSLEWQFYLVAPFAVAALRGRYAALAVAVVLLSFAAYKAKLFGTFYNPSILFGAGHYFLLGIATRLAAEKLPKFETYPYAIALGAAIMLLVDRDLVVLAGWIALVAYFQTAKTSPLLDSRIANWAGARSYSVYILHQPIIYLTVFAFHGLGFWPMFAAVTVVTVVVVTVGAELLYWAVELPAIKFGKSLGRKTLSATPAPASV